MPVVAAAAPRTSFVSFEDLDPAGAAPGWMWHGLGQDPRGRIYVAIGDTQERFGRPGDVNIFRFDPADGHKEHLGSVRKALADLGNLAPTSTWSQPEGVAKIHSDFIEHRGLLYFATHDFHTGDRPDEKRGGHIMSLDPATGRYADLTAHQDLGVAVPNEGIISLNILRDANTLVGLTYPRGRVVLHELDVGATMVFETDRPTDPVEVARTIVVTPGGEVVAASKGAGGESRLYRLDRAAGTLRSLPATFGRGFFEGLVPAPHLGASFMADTDGLLYRLDYETLRLVPLGPIMPNRIWWRARRVLWLRSVAVSPDGSKIFALVHLWFYRHRRHHLVEYDLSSGERTHLGSIGPSFRHAMDSGNAVWDDGGGFYLSCFFGTDREPMEDRNPGLLRIDVSDRI